MNHASVGLDGRLENGGMADPREPLGRLFRDLRSSPGGLSGREAARRLEVWRPNELSRRGGRRWPGELARQFTQPLAVLLALAEVLAWASGTLRLGIPIVAVIFLNGGLRLRRRCRPSEQWRHWRQSSPSGHECCATGRGRRSRPGCWCPGMCC